MDPTLFMALKTLCYAVEVTLIGEALLPSQGPLKDRRWRAAHGKWGTLQKKSVRQYPTIIQRTRKMTLGITKLPAGVDLQFLPKRMVVTVVNIPISQQPWYQSVIMTLECQQPLLADSHIRPCKALSDTSPFAQYLLMGWHLSPRNSSKREPHEAAYPGFC